METKASHQSLKGTFLALTELPEEEWSIFSRALSPKKIPKGGFFVEQGGGSERVGFILSGLMRVYYVAHTGAEFTRTIRTDGQFVAAYTAALAERSSDVAIEALEDTELLVFKYSEFKKGYDRHPAWQEIGRKVAESQYVEYERRGYELLCLPAEERYRCFRRDYAKLAPRLTQAQIASYLGITPVSLSRMLAQSRKKKRGPVS